MRLNWKSLSSLLIGILKEVEELCTKFLQYRIDSRNLIHFLKNTIKYDTPDLRDVVIARLLKDAEKAFENKDEPKKEEKKDTEEVKKDEPKAEEKKDEAKVDVIEIVEEKKTEEPKVEEVPELDYAPKLERVVELVNYYLNEVRPKKILSKENLNDARTKMLESFVAYDGK